MVDYYKSGKPAADKLKSIRFEKSRQKYKSEHDNELRTFYMAERKLKLHFKDGKLPITAWRREREQLELYELQDRIAAVVRCFDGVQEAVVDITPGEDNTFILDSENKYDASAAVFVTMRDGAELTQKQVQGIRNFVSHSVQGLEIDNVTITDSYGNTYSAGDTFTDIQDLSTLKLQLEEQINNKIRTSVLQVLTPIYGTENVKVSVNSIVDLDRSYTDSTDTSVRTGPMTAVPAVRVSSGRRSMRGTSSFPAATRPEVCLVRAPMLI